ncbi:hypothetical protein STHAL_32850 [Streptomyces halstedii]|uniref:Uncharacterized protein n=1 Tax=Streptomyces halstedii TaxID=1944 RepID=A0ABS6U126_STRHA|nr:hypothetical protein [Streptomyces halstedii]MBV7674238.1 hypothetical protein [Streptomyces halstedii]
MPADPPLPLPPAAGPTAPAHPVGVSAGRLGAAEAATVISAIASVTVLAVLERPVPAVLAALVVAAGLLLLPGYALRLLAALTVLAGPRP